MKSTIDWLEGNQLAEAEEFEDKLKARAWPDLIWACGLLRGRRCGGQLGPGSAFMRLALRLCAASPPSLLRGSPLRPPATLSPRAGA